MKAGSHDPLVVSTYDLAKALAPFVRQFKADHKNAYSNHEEDEIAQFGHLEYLSEQAGVPARSIGRILNKKTAFVTLHIADKLLTAVGLIDQLHSAIPVVPNPMWTQEKWEAWRQSCEE